MQENHCTYPIEQNQIVFRTPVGSRPIPAGEQVRLNDGLPNGIPVAKYKTVRIYARGRLDGTINVSFSIFVLDVKNDELIFLLDRFTVSPKGATITKIYDVPGRALVVFATGDPGTGSTGIDFGVIGFGPYPPYGNCSK